MGSARRTMHGQQRAAEMFRCQPNKLVINLFAFLWFIAGAFLAPRIICMSASALSWYYIYYLHLDYNSWERHMIRWISAFRIYVCAFVSKVNRIISNTVCAFTQFKIQMKMQMTQKRHLIWNCCDLRIDRTAAKRFTIHFGSALDIHTYNQIAHRCTKRVALRHASVIGVCVWECGVFLVPSEQRHESTVKYVEFNVGIEFSGPKPNRMTWTVSCLHLMHVPDTVPDRTEFSLLHE